MVPIGHYIYYNSMALQSVTSPKAADRITKSVNLFPIAKTHLFKNQELSQYISGTEIICRPRANS